MTVDDALIQLAGSTAAAVKQVLETFCGETIEVSRVSVVPRGTHPLGAYPFPAVLTNVSYVDGVTGGNVFAITVAGARALAGTMMGGLPEDENPEELSELALSAVGEAGNQMLAAAAAATGEVLRQDVEIDPPETRAYESLDSAQKAFATASHVTTVSFTFQGEPCRLVQLIPQAFVARMVVALQERAEEMPLDALSANGVVGGVSADWLLGAELRLTAELGRTQMPMSRAVALGSGAVVPLDRLASDPVDLYVNGERFATARLMLVDETDWAVRIEALAQPTSDN